MKWQEFYDRFQGVTGFRFGHWPPQFGASGQVELPIVGYEDVIFPAITKTLYSRAHLDAAISAVGVNVPLWMVRDAINGLERFGEGAQVALAGLLRSLLHGDNPLRAKLPEETPEIGGAR